jgi:hypothetical protein
MAHRQLLTGDEHQALLGIPLGPDGWRGASPCPVPIKTSWRSDAETPTASALPFSSLYFITQASRLRSWSSPESYFRPTGLSFRQKDWHRNGGDVVGA